MKRILFVSYTADWSGPTNSLWKLLRYLRPRYDVTVLAPGQGAFSQEVEQAGISYVSVPNLSRTSIGRLYRFIRKGDFHVVYVNTAHGAMRNAVIAAKLAGRPVIWHIREMVGHHPLRNTLFFAFASAMVAVSQACAAQIPRFISRRRIHVVHNGVDFDSPEQDRAASRANLRREFGLPTDSVVVISVANICERKGQIHAVKAMQTLIPAIPGAHLLLIGKLDAAHTAYENALREKIRETGLEGRVQISGFRPDIREFMPGADLFLHTALRDPHPRAVMEAMACALPVVAFAVDGVVETVVHGRTGMLVPPEDGAKLGQAALGILQAPDRGQSLGAAGLEHVRQNFSAESTATRVAAIIEEVIPRG